MPELLLDIPAYNRLRSSTMVSTKIHANYFYKAYGMQIVSDVELSELVPAERSGNDVRIRLGNVNEPQLDAELKGGITRSRDGVTAWATEDVVKFHWRGIGTAVVRKGRDVLIEPEAGLDERDLAPYINGSILAVLLHQRGLMVLHASAVAVDGKAVAFLGDKGAGKSTFAAFLESRGHTLLTDDLVPVKFSAGEVFVLPGFPRIRLWSDSVESIGVDPKSVPKINSFVSKHSYKCTEHFINEPLPLSQLYVLDESPNIAAERLKFNDSFIEIVRNCYFGNYVEATGQTASHFRKCSTLASMVPVHKLKRPHDFNALPDVARLVEGLL